MLPTLYQNRMFKNKDEILFVTKAGTTSPQHPEDVQGIPKTLKEGRYLDQQDA